MPPKKVSEKNPKQTPIRIQTSDLSISVSPPPSPAIRPSPPSLYHTEALISNLKSSGKKILYYWQDILDQENRE